MKKYFSKVGLATTILYLISLGMLQFLIPHKTVYDRGFGFELFVSFPWAIVFAVIGLYSLMLAAHLVFIIYLLNAATFYFFGRFLEYILQKARILGLVLITAYLLLFVGIAGFCINLVFNWYNLRA